MSHRLAKCDLYSARGLKPCGALSFAKTTITKTTTRC